MDQSAQPVVNVVDDNEALRDSLKWLLESAGHSVAVHASAEAFLGSYRPEQPGCLVLDIRMPGMSGLELQDELIRLGHAVPIIFITGHGDVPTAVSAVKKGAVEFLEKPFSDKALLSLVGNALAFDAQMRSAADGLRSVEARLASLTQREREVMDLVVAGKRNREIAEQLQVSIKTVEAHRAKIMQKTAAGTLAELLQVVHAASSGRSK